MPAKTGVSVRGDDRDGQKSVRLFHWRIECALHFQDVVLIEPVNLGDGARRIGAFASQFLLGLIGDRPEPVHVGDVDHDPHAIAQVAPSDSATRFMLR
jgi:hypothetical protein